MRFHPLLIKFWLALKKSFKRRQSKGNYSSRTDNTLINVDVHIHTMDIYTQYNFHDIPSITYKVKAEDGINH